jgi:L-iditol 2-dehydrogenase
MKQLVCITTGVVDFIEANPPVRKPGDLLVALRACGICGTDVMKVFDPSVPRPVQIGHEIVGQVLFDGSGLSKGQRVAVAHHAPNPNSHYARRGSETQDPAFKSSNVEPGGFAEIIRIPAELVPHTVHAIPDEMPDLRAVFMEPLACCLRAIERGRVAEEDTVLVVGVGAIGLLFVPVLRNLGAKVIATDVRDDRLQMATAWGASAALNADRDDIASEVHRLSASRGADLVILTAVNRQTFALALATVRDGGTIIPFGVKPGTELPVDLWQTYRREISFVASYSATPTGLKRSMALLRQPGFAFETVVSHNLPLAQGQAGFDMLHHARASKVVLTAENE